MKSAIIAPTNGNSVSARWWPVNSGADTNAAVRKPVTTFARCDGARHT
jgi:hypothetical protein